MSVSAFQPSRRSVLALGLSALAATGLAACSNGPAPSSTTDNVDGFDAVIKAGKTASDSVINGNAWAKAIKDRGTLQVGQTSTAAIFSFEDKAKNTFTGFDAGLIALLTKYILGDATKLERKQPSVPTREAMLQNGTVDVMIATYSITAKRQEVVAFAGPYFVSGVGVLTRTGDKVTSLAEIKGKKVVTQSNSANLKVLQDAGIPDTDVTTFEGNADCTKALIDKRVDVYVNDYSLLLGQAQQNQGRVTALNLNVNADPYGIGVKLENKATAVEFLNTFLKSIEDDGSWAKLWKATVGTVVEGDAPAPPAITQTA